MMNNKFVYQVFENTLRNKVYNFNCKFWFRSAAFIFMLTWIHIQGEKTNK